MKERPILFSAPMVRVLLDGSKTQTRRALKVHCEAIGERYDGSHWPWSEDPETGGDHWHLCPFGQAGDRLWVRESYRFTDVFDIDSPARVADRCIDAGFSTLWAPIQYDADGARRDWRHTGTPPHDNEPKAGKGRASIHMPRWASRILLEITGVRIERLQEISEPDALAEGIKELNGRFTFNDGMHESRTAIESYHALWESINGAGSWDANPWVWVVEFKRVAP